MTLNNVFDHYRQHLSRMVKPSTREDYNKRLAMLPKFCAMHNATTIDDIVCCGLLLHLNWDLRLIVANYYDADID